MYTVIQFGKSQNTQVEKNSILFGFSCKKNRFPNSGHGLLRILDKIVDCLRTISIRLSFVVANSDGFNVHTYHFQLVGFLVPEQLLPKIEKKTLNVGNLFCYLSTD